MYSYNRIAGFTAKPNHVGALEEYPRLVPEDISFFGLLTAAVEAKAIDPRQLPGFDDGLRFTDRDRGMIRAALRSAGVKLPESRLEVCTLPIEESGPTESNFYTLSGSNQHGLAIVSHSLGLCTQPKAFLTRQQG